MTLPHSVAVQCIFAAHAQIATFARESFTHDGRGVVMIDFPITQGTNVVAATMNYHHLTSVRELAAEMPTSCFAWWRRTTRRRRRLLWPPSVRAGRCPSRSDLITRRSSTINEL